MKRVVDFIKPILRLGVILLLTIFICLWLAVYTLDRLFYVSPELRAARASARATESALTLSHGTEAYRAIQAFIDRNWSLAAYRNPNLLSEVATGQNLKELQALN